VSSLATHLDLNSLHDLSRTCRQFRANLLEHRKQLIGHALRCSREDESNNVKLADGLKESLAAWHTNDDRMPSGRLTSGKIGQCARDKVGQCRRCSTIVCRVRTLFLTENMQYRELLANMIVELHSETSTFTYGARSAS
jgi:hypothetical protein